MLSKYTWATGCATAHEIQVNSDKLVLTTIKKNASDLILNDVFAKLLVHFACCPLTTTVAFKRTNKIAR